MYEELNYVSNVIDKEQCLELRDPDLNGGMIQPQ